MLRRHNVFRAAFTSRCRACLTLIRPGQRARFDPAYATAVHDACEDIVRLVTQNQRYYPERQRNALSPWVNGELPHGLRPGTLDTYTAEWRRYLSFAEGFGFGVSIPGRDVPRIVSRRRFFLACRP